MTVQTPDQTRAQPRPLWRNRAFLLLWSGQAISVTGTTASRITFPLLVLYLTNSPFQAGLVSALETVPFLILGLPAGALIDRWNRKRVMILCDTIRALAYAVIPLTLWTGHLSMPVIYAVVLVEGIGFSFFNLAEVSALPQVVPPEQISAASASNQAMYAAGSLAGPPLGGLLYSLNRAFPFGADALSYAASAISLLFIRRPFQGERPDLTRPLHLEVWEGMRWLWGHPLIRFFGLIGGVQGLVFSGVPLGAIVLSRQVFHASAATIGLLFGLAAVGGIAGAVIGGWLQTHLTLRQAVLGGVWAGALAFWVLALAPSLLILAVGGALLFFTAPLYDIAQFSYRMTRIPDALQGRVNSLYRVIMWGGQPLGSILSGALIQALGPRTALEIIAAGAIAVALTATLNRNLHRAER